MTATGKITFSKSFKCYLEKDIDIEYCVKLETIATELMGFDDFLKKKNSLLHNFWKCHNTLAAPICTFLFIINLVIVVFPNTDSV